MDIAIACKDQLTGYGFVPMNHKAPNFFPVDAGPIFDHDGTKIPGWQRVFRGDSGDTLGVHTDKYAMVPYEDNYAKLEEAIRQSGLPLEDMQVHTDMSDNGARIFREYVFPGASAEIDGQRLALRIISFDSYNGTASHSACTGFFNFVCANRSLIGKRLVDFKFKHTGQMAQRVDKAARQLADAGPRFFQECDRMVKWVNLLVSADDAGELVSRIPQGSKSLTDELVSKFARAGGRNLWDLNNVLTAWATHGCPAKTSADRQKRVADLVEGKDWHLVEVSG